MGSSIPVSFGEIKRVSEGSSPCFFPDGRRIAFICPDFPSLYKAIDSGQKEIPFLLGIFELNLSTGKRKRVSWKTPVASQDLPLICLLNKVLCMGWAKCEIIVEMEKQRKKRKARFRQKGWFRPWLIDLRTGEEKPITNVEALTDRFLTVSSDGRWVSFVGPKKGVACWRAEILQLKDPTRPPGMNNPFIRKVVPMPYDAIWASEIEGGKERQLTFTPESSDFAPSFHPKSCELIAFTRKRRGFEDVWVLDIGKRKEKPLTQGGLNFLPFWSPDGGKIAFFRREWTHCSIWVKDLKSGKEARVAPVANPKGRLRWSPDGKRLFFVRDKDLWVADLESGRNRSITVAARVKGQFDLSPDGRKIVFCQISRLKSEICLIELPPELWPEK